MTGITKAEQERRRLRRESCNHWAWAEGPWRWYATLQAVARRDRCVDCGAWCVIEKADLDATDEHYAGLADARGL